MNQLKVDINGQAELYQLIHRTQQALNCAVLMVSHDLHRDGGQ